MPKIAKTKIKDYPSVEKFVLKAKKPHFIESKIRTQLENIASIDANNCKNVEENTCVQATITVSTMTATAAATTITTATETAAVPECYDELKLLEKEYKICEQNLKTAKNLLRKSSDLNLEKDLRIQQILNHNSKAINECPVLFENYSNSFDDLEMIGIRSIGPGINKDSTFICSIMKYLYKNEPEKIGDRSATGKKFKGKKNMK